MARRSEIYRCGLCGNVVEVVEGHEGTLVCCGQDMFLLVAKTLAEEGREKHVPVIEIKGNIVKVKVGSVPHPMEERHFIGLIEVLKDGRVIASRNLRPGEKPESEFCLKDTDRISAREYCNVHGLWSN